MYQTAKVAKLLLLLNAGKGNEFKGKALADIEITDDVLNLDEIPEADTEKTCEESLQVNSQLEKNDNFMEASVQDEQIPSTSKHGTEKKMMGKSNETKGRHRWTNNEKQIVLSFFKNHIKKKIPPKKQECLSLISAHPDIFNVSDWVRIKTLIFNTYRVK